VWEHILKLLENPELIHVEIERRIKETKYSIPTNRRKEAITKELNRIQKGIDKLLDAYQEDLLPLPELRKRIPQLRKREKSIRFELQNLETNSMEQKNYVQLYENIGTFLSRMRDAAEHMTTEEKQKIIRLVVKEILIGPDTITIKHSIPISKSPKSRNLEISRLRSCCNESIFLENFSFSNFLFTKYLITLRRNNSVRFDAMKTKSGWIFP
jgi:site-specific DNA recombinase